MSRAPFGARRPGLVLAAALGLAAASAQAEPPAAATLAQTLFDEARRLMSEGKYAEACAKFTESQRLDPGSGTLLNLAVCHEAEGKTATAWAEFKEALGQARHDGREDREQLIQQRLAALEPRLARLRVEVPRAADVAGLRVLQDGVELGRAAWGLAVPVDPGPHEVRAEAPGRRPWSAAVTASAGGQERVEIPALEGPAAPGGGWSSRRIAGAITLGLGAGVLGLGAYFGVVALQKQRQSDDLCPGERCEPGQASAVPLNQEAQRAARRSNGALLGGLLLSGAGTYLLLTSATASPQASSTPRSTLAAAASPQGGALLWRYRW